MSATKIMRFRKEYWWLSNMASVDIYIDGFHYHSVEAAYQSHKSDDYSWKEFCADSANSPGDIKRESRAIKLREDWKEVREEIMLKCMRLKYKRNFYRIKLLSTGDAEIIEGNYHNDKYWGVCLKSNPPVGLNRSGILIMKIRDEIRQELKGVEEECQKF